MEKIGIKVLVDFRRKSERGKITLVRNLKKINISSENDESSGGDYWISCLSAIANTFKDDDNNLLTEKINLLVEKIKATNYRRTKNQFQSNIDVLYSFGDFDFQEIKPDVKLSYLKKPTNKSILHIAGLPIYVKPNHVFTFSTKDRLEIGAVWFIAQKDGFSKGELGMFVEVLYQYLSNYYDKEFNINTTYCIVVDVNKAQRISYKDLQEGKVPKLLVQTIEELKSFLLK